jgi:hypothetical protein
LPVAQGLALRGRQPYLLPVMLPRPAAPRAFLADLRAFIGAGQHRVIAAILALMVPMLIFAGFVLQERAYRPPEQTVTVQMWSAKRTDAEIIADQKKAQAKKDERAKERQRQFRKLADMLGIDTE